jgi:phage terminase Nu1 subunit (DNA packaging protein)
VAVEIVTKAELSRILGVSRVRVTQYARMGMPVLSDGKLGLAACLEWLRGRNETSRERRGAVSLGKWPDWPAPTGWSGVDVSA